MVGGIRTATRSWYIKRPARPVTASRAMQLPSSQRDRSGDISTSKENKRTSNLVFLLYMVNDPKGERLLPRKVSRNDLSPEWYFTARMSVFFPQW
jgi:hypothetical protein